MPPVHISDYTTGEGYEKEEGKGEGDRGRRPSCMGEVESWR